MMKLELNEHTIEILGKPCFAIMREATRLRQLGWKIEKKAESEQANVLYFFLTMYEKHGNEWKKFAYEYLNKNIQESPAQADN